MLRQIGANFANIEECSRNVLLLSTDRSKARRSNAVACAFLKAEGKSCAAVMRRAKNFSDIPERLAALTERQQQVATLVHGGLSNKTIAQKLGVSEGTVKAHLHAIYGKLRLSPEQRS